MNDSAEKQLTKTIAPLIPSVVPPLVVSVIVTGIGMFSMFQVASYRIEQAERKIIANEVRFEEFTKETRDADKLILESTARQLDEIKKSLFRIEGRLEAK